MMGRAPRRASGMKALQAIKANSGHGSRVSKKDAGGKPKRSVLGNVTNQALPSRSGKQAPSKQTTTAGLKSYLVTKEAKENLAAPAPELVLPELCMDSSLSSEPSDSRGDTPITTMKNSLQATTLSDVGLQSPSSPPALCFKDIDAAEAHDSLFSSEYAPDIYAYMREREVHFLVPAYMTSQNDISPCMRTILVDWLIEVQENFELFHETLYLAVQLTDQYLAKKDVRREYLQLVGATCMLIAAKFEELVPPLVDDFLYLCDDAYTHEDLLKMEQDILCVLEYDINIPVAYRFLRRLARAAEATMETHTLARYITESTLQEYSFVTERPSLVAASAMYLAIRMKQLGAWTPTLLHYSGYTVREMLPMVKRLNKLLESPLGQTATVRSKYSHEVFFKVASVPTLQDVDQDASIQ